MTKIPDPENANPVQIQNVNHLMNCLWIYRVHASVNHLDHLRHGLRLIISDDTSTPKYYDTITLLRVGINVPKYTQRLG